MTVDHVDWPALRDRVFGRIDPIVAAGKAYRQGPDCPNVTVYTGTARFVGRQAARHGYRHGGRRRPMGTSPPAAAPTVPAIAGLDLGPRIHTSDSIMQLDELPNSVVIFGGGFIAAEFAHVFHAFGCEVVQVIRDDRLLRRHDADISEAFTAAAQRRWTLLSGTGPDVVSGIERWRRGAASGIAGSQPTSCSWRRVGFPMAICSRSLGRVRRRPTHWAGGRRRLPTDLCRRASSPSATSRPVGAQTCRQPRDACRPPQPRPSPFDGAQRPSLRPGGGVHRSRRSLPSG